MNGARARIAPRGTPGPLGPRASTFGTRWLVVGLLGLGLAASRTARADPHPLPFSYPYSTLPRGLTELEQYMDMTPLHTVVNPQVGSGSTRNRLQGIFVTELEYGITDRLELGLYLQFSNDLSGSTGQQPVQFDGVKQRLRYRFADPGAWPVNLAIYGEVAELSSELELEAKIILERRFGPWQWIVNLTGEHERYYEGERELVFVPSGGVSYEVTPACRIGAEYWGRVEHAFDASGDAPFSSLWHHYVGPTFLFQTSRVWLAAAPYVRVDHLGRTGEVGDELGRFWFRTIVGIDL